MNVVHLVSNKVWGGGERYALDLCRRLEADGHSVAVITRGYDAVDRPFIDAGFTPGRLPLGGLFDFISPSRLSRVLDSIEGPVVVHVHNFKDARTAVAARRLMRSPDKVRIVATRHLVKPGKSDRSSAELYAALDAIVFVSQTAFDVFLAGKPRVDAERLMVVPSAIPARPVPEPLPRPDDEFRLVYAGRLVHEKGIELLLDAMATMPRRVKLHVCGSGKPDYERLLRRYAHTIGVEERVVWHGHLPDPLPLMASASAGVVPTLATEAFGLAVLEFMSCGVPVVASGAGGPAEIITDGVDGLLFVPGEPNSLSRAVTRLADDPKLRNQLAQNCKFTYNRRYDYDFFYSQMVKIYRKTS